MGLKETTLEIAMEYCHEPQMEIDYFGQQCFGWYQLELEDGQLITYCGGNTIGFGSYLGFNKKLSTGVILWYNADFKDGANLNLGPAILKAINKNKILAKVFPKIKRRNTIYKSSYFYPVHFYAYFV